MKTNQLLKLFAVICFAHLIAITSTVAMTPVKTFQGEAAYDQFGISLSSCDFNGDGWTDLVIGANTNDAGGSAAGRVYVYLGADNDTIPDLILTGPTPGGHFGWCVRGIGDFNNDGYEDIAVGAHFDSEFNTRSGKAYVFLGSDSLDSEWDLLLVETSYDARFGYSIAGGDFNGDGYADLAIGAPNANDKGMVKIFFGGSSLDDSCDYVVYGEGTYDFFGSAIAMEGDLNGDGYDDLVIGAYGYNNLGALNAGRVYVYFGSSSPDTVPDLIITGEYANDYLGASVSTGGDLDGDGFDDLYVGSYGSDIGDSSEVGKVFVFMGGPTMDAVADLVLWSGATHNERFGISVSAGPRDSSSSTVILVGAEQNDEGGTDAGKAYAFRGSQPQAGAPDDEFAGIEAGAYLGHAVWLVSHVYDLASGPLALVGAYGEAETGVARLLSFDFAGITRTELGPALRISPNPVCDGSMRFVISPQHQGKRVSIVDVTGRLVVSFDLPRAQTMRLDPQALGLRPGVYFIAVDSDEGSHKLVILR